MISQEVISDQDLFFERSAVNLPITQLIVFDEDIKLANLKKEKRNYQQSPTLYRELSKQIRKLEWYQKDFTQPKLDMLVREYKKWLKEDLYLEFLDNETKERIFRRVAKRGNSVYKRLVKKRLGEYTNFMGVDKFKQFILREHNTKSNVLFLTLTWDTKIFLGDRKRAWRSIEYFYNKFITRFRKKYGKCWILKGVEATDKGYPHMHLLIVCENSFSVFPYRNKEGKQTFRILQKKEIGKMWNSFIDIEVPRNLKAVSKYVVKDIIKQYNKKRRTDRDFLSLALCWIFRKRSFSISTIHDEFISMCISQTQLEEIYAENPERELIFIGLVRISFGKDRKPPDEFELKLSEDKLHSLKINRIRTQVKTEFDKTQDYEYIMENGFEETDLPSPYCFGGDDPLRVKLNGTIQNFEDIKPKTEFEKDRIEFGRLTDLENNNKQNILKNIKLNQQIDLIFKGKC